LWLHVWVHLLGCSYNIDVYAENIIVAFTVGNSIESSGRISAFYLKLKCIKEHITVGMFYSPEQYYSLYLY